MLLKNQVALVTACPIQGCGRGIALQLGQAGATVYITALRPEKEDEVVKSVQHKLPALEDVAREITTRGGRGIAVYCDHRDSKQVANLFNQICEEQNSQLDILVNNVFSAVTTVLKSVHKKFYDLPEEFFDICNDAGLRGHHICSRHAAKMMVPRRSGLIVEIGSLGGICYVYNTAYGINKTDHLAADVALELKEFGITSVAFVSGPVESELYLPEVGLIQIELEEIVNKYYRKKAETTEFQGKCLVAFASDPNRFQRTGHILFTQELAKEYGIFENDDRQPSYAIVSEQVPMVVKLNETRSKIRY